jgi:hypothetical protein
MAPGAGVVGGLREARLPFGEQPGRNKARHGVTSVGVLKEESLG